MKTRSATTLESDFEQQILDSSYPEIPQLYSVDIDFDGASESWKANKKSIGNGSYKYVCQAKTSTGKCCTKKALSFYNFCKTHENIKEKSEKSEKSEKKCCPGCYPNFQPNQLAHVGPNGCLGDDEIF